MIDCEIVAVASVSDEISRPLRLLPMQMMTGGGGGGEGNLPALSGGNQRLCVFAFDLLVCEGEVLVDEPLAVRREKLREVFGPERGKFEFVGGDDIHGETGAAAAETTVGDEAAAAGGSAGGGVAAAAGAGAAAEDLDGEDEEAGGRAGVVASHVAALCRAAVDAGCEGLMVKSLDGPTAVYAPAKRCETAWIKLKKDYLADGLADTLDLVPIAAWQ